MVGQTDRRIDRVQLFEVFYKLEFGLLIFQTRKQIVYAEIHVDYLDYQQPKVV